MSQKKHENLATNIQLNQFVVINNDQDQLSFGFLLQNKMRFQNSITYPTHMKNNVITN